MKALAGCSCGADDRVLRSFFVGTFRSRLNYAAQYLITVPPSSLHPLETAQNSDLRNLLGAPPWGKCVCLLAEAFICCVTELVMQPGVYHLAILMRRAEAAPLAEQVKRSLHHDHRLFQRQTW